MLRHAKPKGDAKVPHWAETGLDQSQNFYHIKMGL